MKTKGCIVLVGAFILLLALSGCTTCPTASLQAPVLTGPAMWSVVGSLTPSLTWSYPDSTCTPQGYAITLKTGPFFTDSLGGGTGNPSTSWGPGSSLQPGREYEWGVSAINGSTLGPFAGFNYFFTGPMCATDALAASTLLQPANGAVVNTLDPTLIWQYPNPCLPQSYRIDLSTDATFADTSLSGGTGNPSTRWGPGAPLADCTVYFWKVAPFSDSTLGPPSGVFAFTTNASGTCATPTPVGVATPTPIPVGPSPTPAPGVATDTPSPVPFMFTPNINVNCRLGPDPVFDIFDVAMKGQPYLMDGRNLANTWYRIMFTANAGCWVAASSGSPSRDPSTLRVLTEPPTPVPTLVPSSTPTVLACSSFNTQRSCLAQPACTWKMSPSGAGACMNK